MASGDCDTVIVGAGPYGLSIAAHLAAQGIPFRIFGQPMMTWRRMPPGTFLKSLGFATDIYIPGSRQNFVAYMRERNLETVEPCAMSDFAEFGVWLQKSVVPTLETVDVKIIRREGTRFRVTTCEGETFSTQSVIVATGLNHLELIPPELRSLPRGTVTHTSEHDDYQGYDGRDVCVIGSGASALEAAAQLSEAGAHPIVIARGPSIGFTWKTKFNRSLYERLRRPNSVIGFGLRSWVFEKLPILPHCFPDQWRIDMHHNSYGPLGGWWLRDRVEGKIPSRTACRIVAAEPRDGRIAVVIEEQGKGRSELICDHVVAGSGYDLNVDRLPFLDDAIKAGVGRIEKAPKLNRHFESSERGLFFVGSLSSLSFGPIFRFIAGAEYTSRTLSRVLAGRRNSSSPSGTRLAVAPISDPTARQTFPEAKTTTHRAQ